MSNRGTEEEKVSIEGLRIEADENGFELVIEGDLVEECEAYLAAEGLTLRLNIQAAALEFAGSAGLHELLAWRAEGLMAGREHSRAREDGDAYTPDDPKHPGYHGRIAAIHDDREKAS